MKEFNIQDYYPEGMEGLKKFLRSFDVSLFKKFNMNIDTIKLTLEIFPVTVDDDGGFFIATGTQQAPRGISNFKGKAVVISNFKDDEPLITTVNSLREAIKGNPDLFKREPDKEYRIMGFKGKFTDLKKKIEEVECPF